VAPSAGIVGLPTNDTTPNGRREPEAAP